MDRVRLPIMTLGELRELTKDLPDDTELVLDPGDGEYTEAHHRYNLPPVLDNPWAVVLGMGQPINLDLDLDHRIDATP